MSVASTHQLLNLNDGQLATAGCLSSSRDRSAQVCGMTLIFLLLWSVVELARSLTSQAHQYFAQLGLDGTPYSVAHKFTWTRTAY
jgi:hypothetical protein